MFLPLPAPDAAAVAALESQSRYITRPTLAMDALEKHDDGTLALETPPDPRTGATRVVLDPLEWIHRITAHIPDPGRHCHRFYGAYSNRGRISVAPTEDKNAASPSAKHSEQDISDCSRQARGTWARLIKKIFEADPLLCPCGGRMRIVSFITGPRVVDRILRHRESGRGKTRSGCHARPYPFLDPFNRLAEDNLKGRQTVTGYAYHHLSIKSAKILLHAAFQKGFCSSGGIVKVLLRCGAEGSTCSRVRQREFSAARLVFTAVCVASRGNPVWEAG